MNEKNICKFVPTKFYETLKTSCFVCERQNVLSKPINFPEHTLFLFSEGDGVLKMGGNSYALKAGTLFLVFADLTFSIEGSKDAEYFYVKFKGERAQELFNRFQINSRNFIFEDYGSLVSFWRSCLVHADESTIDLVSESVILYSFSKLKNVQNNENKVIEFVLQYAEENFSDSTLKLSTIAELLFYNPKYLSVLFKKERGIGFSQFLQDLRIQHSFFLIEQGITSVKNIAILCGFTDPLYFSKFFKNKIGLSPKEYIEKNKK